MQKFKELEGILILRIDAGTINVPDTTNLDAIEIVVETPAEWPVCMRNLTKKSITFTILTRQW